MKDMGEAGIILGIKIKNTNNCFSLCQFHYVKKMLKKFNYFDVLLVRTPYDPNIHLKKNKGSIVFQTKYAKIIGSVMFLMTYTQPKIAYVVTRLSRYTHNANKQHYDSLFQLLKYFKVPWISICILINFMERSKVFVIQTRYLIMVRTFLLVVMCLHWVEKLSCGSLQSRLV